MFAIWAYSVRCWKVCPRELLDRRVNYYIHQLSWVKTYISIYGPLYSDRLNQHESQIAQRIILTHGRIGTLINDIIGYPLDACIAKIEPIQFVKRAEGFCFYIQNIFSTFGYYHSNCKMFNRTMPRMWLNRNRLFGRRILLSPISA